MIRFRTRTGDRRARHFLVSVKIRLMSQTYAGAGSCADGALARVTIVVRARAVLGVEAESPWASPPPSAICSSASRLDCSVISRKQRHHVLPSSDRVEQPHSGRTSPVFRNVHSRSRKVLTRILSLPPVGIKIIGDGGRAILDSLFRVGRVEQGPSNVENQIAHLPSRKPVAVETDVRGVRVAEERLEDEVVHHVVDVKCGLHLRQ